VTTADEPDSQHAHYTRLSADYINAHKLPGEAIGVAIEPGGWAALKPPQPAPGQDWTVTLKLGDVGIRANCGADPDDDTLMAVLAGVLADARRQAAIGAEVKRRRYGPRAE